MMLDRTPVRVQPCERFVAVVANEVCSASTVEKCRESGVIAGSKHGTEDDLERRVHLLQSDLIGQVSNDPASDLLVCESKAIGERVASIGWVEYGPEDAWLVVPRRHDDVGWVRTQCVTDAQFHEARY
ncbi:hypothetical protein BDK89_2327 [Ilumatobacter fluminis]|uniref:Uncharacterized protein n=1 Tax=Ilumatobacter fluminis TaxID=467091 RepID=A0A4R7HZQ4_9ACTN|nr:hypothetical protein BDK89_2327 [Ilumatobacter fluminis]